RRQQRKMRKQFSENRSSLTRFMNLFKVAVGNGASPIKIVFNVINLKAGARMRAKDFDLVTGQGMTIDRPAFEEIVNRDNIWLAIINTAKPANSGGGQ